jgi:hypothetical protein
VELKIPVGPRAIGMGEAYGAVANDANAVYWNPAGLRQLGGIHITAQYNDFINTLKYNYLAAAMPMSNGKYAVGLGVKMLSSGNEDEILVNALGDPVTTGSKISSGYMDVDLSFACKINYSFDLGLTVKYISKKLNSSESVSSTSFAGDLGLMFRPPVKNLTTGLVVQNLGPGMKFNGISDKLPLNIKLASAYKMFENNFTVAFDVNFPNDNKPVASLGGEYWYRNRLVGRFGYRYQGGLDWNDLGVGGKAGLFLGAGLKFPAMGTMLGLDYAWSTQGFLGTVHRIGLNVYL